MAAMDAEIRGADRVREVFARVRNGDAGVADLYSEDGIVVVGNARIEGREAVRAFYQKAFDALHPQPDVQVVLSEPDSDLFVAIVEVPNDRGHVHALDMFTIDDEGIRQLEIFNRSID
jgi:ketosteroid isomerase-like protein